LLILGALLHDVGKFAQRASDNPKIQDHSHWGVEWFENNFAKKLKTVFSQDEIQIIRSAISNHHGYEEYISLADAISAGLDRIKLEDEEKGDPFTDRLVSIFSRISISPKQKKDMYHKLAFLEEDCFEEAFPIDAKKCTFKEYGHLLTAFNQDYEDRTIDLIKKGLRLKKLPIFNCQLINDFLPNHFLWGVVFGNNSDHSILMQASGFDPKVR